MVRRETEDIMRYFIWVEIVRGYSNILTKIFLVLLTQERVVGSVRENGRKNVRIREGFDDGRVSVRKNGRKNARKREEWEGFGHRFNIAAGFSPATKEKKCILKIQFPFIRYHGPEINPKYF